MKKFLRGTSLAAFVAGTLVSGSIAAQAAPPFNLYDTGVTTGGTTSAGGGQATPGAVDAHYTLFSEPTGATTGGPFVSTGLNGYAANDGTGQFISPAAAITTSQPAGTYDYRTTFSLAGQPTVSGITLSGKGAADDYGSAIQVNGFTISGTGNPITTYSAVNSFSYFIPSADLVNGGTNNLDFLVTNVGTTQTGLLVEDLAITTTAPEINTSSAALPLAVTFCAIAVLGDRRRKISV